MSLMQRIPLHANEVEKFTPACLHDQAQKPIFMLKAPTRRQREDLSYAMRQDGFRVHQQEEMREVAIEELCRLWACGQDDEEIQKVRAFWQAEDDYAEDQRLHQLEVQAAADAGEEPPADLEAFTHPDQAMIKELYERLDDNSPRLRRMVINNAKYQRAFPLYAIAHCVTEWTGLETPAARHGEVLSIDTVFDLEGELEEKFGDLGALASVELGATAINRFFLGKSAEKNSGSAPASPQTRPTSKETGSVSPPGTSPESAPSAETPAD